LPEDFILICMQKSTFSEKIVNKGFFKPPDRILDVGCGDATDACTFSKHQFIVDAFDRDPLRIKSAKDENRGLNLSVSSIEDYVFPESIYTFVYSKNVLSFLDSKKTIFKTIERMKSALVPNGFMYITLMGKEDPFVLEGKAIGFNFVEIVDYLKDNHFTFIETHSFKDVGEYLYESGSKVWHWHQFLLQCDK